MAGGKLRLFACRSAVDFSKKVAVHLNRYLSYERKILDDSIARCNPNCYFYQKERKKLEVVVVENSGENGLEFTEHANGEFDYKIKEGDEYSVRGDIAYVIQLPERNPLLGTSIHDNFMEMVGLVETLNGSGVKEVNVILPSIPYSRQDAQSGREAVMTKAIARIIENCKINSLTTIDVHSKAAFNNAYNIKTEALYSSSVIIPVLKEEMDNDLSDLVILSPDVGGAKKARHYSEKMGGVPLVGIKIRPAPGIVGGITILGDVKDKNVIVVDDIFDTLGTLVKAVNAANDQGARSVYCAGTHGLFNRDSMLNLQILYSDGKLKKVITTDSVNQYKKSDIIRVASVTNMLGNFIFCSYLEKPVSAVYKPAEKF